MPLNLINLYIAIFIILFLPGVFFLMALTGKKDVHFSAIEKYVLSFGLSIVCIDALALLLNFLNVPLTKSSVLVSVIIFILLCIIISKRTVYSTSKSRELLDNDAFDSLANWPYRKILIFITIFSLAVLLRAFYIARSIMPQTTDLGHHMYWAKYIVDFFVLPEYGMPDFIIGEHIIFAVISFVSGISFISAMPVVILFIINIFSLLAIFILTFRFSLLFFTPKNSKKVSLLALLIIGCFYAISAPQAKFISGGVIGNILGNFLIPLTLYSLLRTIQEKRVLFAQLFVIFTVTSAYTHHLSTFILLYVLVGSFAASLFFLTINFKTNIKGLFSEIKNVLIPFLNVRTLLVVVIAVFFILIIRTPSYLNTSAIDTAVGTPMKDTRVGLTLNNIAMNSGPWRFFYAGIGALSLILLTIPRALKKSTKKSFSIIMISSVIFLGWLGIIFLMSWKPALLKIDIPSNRIASYITYPLSIFSAFGVYFVLDSSRRRLSAFLYTTIFLVVIGTGFISGYSDISDSARTKNPSEEKKIKQTYLASEYLNSVSKKDEQILKDHIYLEGDTWIKLFFMRGYNYPLSRSFLKRYSDPAKERETCTRDMIAIPDSKTGLACFEETNVRYIMLNSKKETAQFEKSPLFNKIYTSDYVTIFERIK